MEVVRLKEMMEWPYIVWWELATYDNSKTQRDDTIALYCLLGTSTISITLCNYKGN